MQWISRLTMIDDKDAMLLLASFECLGFVILEGFAHHHVGSEAYHYRGQCCADCTDSRGHQLSGGQEIVFCDIFWLA